MKPLICNMKLLLSLIMLSATVFAQSAPASQVTTVSYMFNVVSPGLSADEEAEIVLFLNEDLIEIVEGVECVARAEVTTFVPDRLVVGNDRGGLGVVELTYNCEQTAQKLVDQWIADPRLKMFGNVRIGPDPVVSGSN